MYSLLLVCLLAHADHASVRYLQTYIYTLWVGDLSVHGSFSHVILLYMGCCVGLAVTFVSDEPDAKVLNDVQDRFEVNITELPDEIDLSTYSKFPVFCQCPLAQSNQLPPIF